MPKSSSACPAGCIFGLSFFEPMMIPTRGASTSISASPNAVSTSGIGSVAAGWATPVSVLGSCIGAFSPSRRGSGHAGDGPGGDVGAHLLALELDHPSRVVGALARDAGVRAECRHVQDPATGGDHVAGIVACGP